MTWTVVVSESAKRSLKRIPLKDRQRIDAVLEAMAGDPFQGDVKRMQGSPGFRRRVGDWRILFRTFHERALVVVSGIVRRTSTTY